MAAAARRLSEELGRLAEVCSAPTVTLRSLVPAEDPRAHALLALFLSVCFLHPFPMPGVSALFGSVIAIAGVRMALRRGIWLPERWADRPVPAKALSKVFSASHRLALRFERLLRPRGSALVTHRWGMASHGIAIAVCGVLLAVPLPPPTNFPPATAILLLSIAVLERDALLLAAGYCAFGLNLVFFGAIGVFGLEGLRALLG